MADLLATLFKFRQFAFEYMPFFLAAWLGLAVATGLITAAQRKGINFEASSRPFLKYRFLRWMWRLLFFLLWRPDGRMPVLSTFSGLLLFSLVASIPALVVTSLIGMKVVWLRLILTTLYALFLRWLLTSALPSKWRNQRKQRLEAESAFRSRVLPDDSSLSPPRGLYSFVQVVWKSFSSQVEGMIIPLVIGFSLASALTIYVPAYVIRPWLDEGVWQGPYLAALLSMPFQLTGGAEVLLASALLVKGASLGTVLSLMLVAPSTTFPVLRHLYQPMNVKTVTLYLIATWLVAGSLGVAVDGIQRLFAG
jgi:uncharacterized membrane protein YraQ (UPF0718 family)